MGFWLIENHTAKISLFFNSCFFQEFFGLKKFEMIPIKKNIKQTEMTIMAESLHIIAQRNTLGWKMRGKIRPERAAYSFP